MKIKRFEAVPLDYEIETNAPLLVKLRVYGTFWRFVRLCKVQLTVLTVPRCDQKPIGRPFWYLFYPRIKWVKV